MTIKDIRDKIDSIDQEIAKLLQRRWDLVSEIKSIKKLARGEAGYRPFRELAIYYKLPDGEKIQRDNYWTIWKELMVTTVMQENPFSVAVAQEFFDQHGFSLAQEFGRKMQWHMTKNPLASLIEKQAGLAILGLNQAGDFLKMKDKVAIVNIFPSFLFDDKKYMDEKNIKGVIVAWQMMEQPADQESCLYITTDPDGKNFLIHDTKMENTIAIVPKPPYWKNKK